MRRRGFLELLGGAVAVAAFPLSAPLSRDLKPEFYRDGDGNAYVVISAPRDVRAADYVLLRGVPLGVALHEAKRGCRLVVQVYGHAKVRVSA